MILEECRTADGQLTMATSLEGMGRENTTQF